jgi:hypothetical protein
MMTKSVTSKKQPTKVADSYVDEDDFALATFSNDTKDVMTGGIELETRFTLNLPTEIELFQNSADYQQ